MGQTIMYNLHELIEADKLRDTLIIVSTFNIISDCTSCD